MLATSFAPPPRPIFCDVSATGDGPGQRVPTSSALFEGLCSKASVRRASVRRASVRRASVRRASVRRASVGICSKGLPLRVKVNELTVCLQPAFSTTVTMCLDSISQAVESTSSYDVFRSLTFSVHTT